MAVTCTIVDEPTQVCVSCPEQPAVTAVPVQTLTDPRLGWNASARSVVELSGDCYAAFAAPQVIGVVIGFAPEYIPADPASVRHGFYLFQRSGRDVYQVIERGIVQTAYGTRNIGVDHYRIERLGTQVQYKVNNVVVHTSAVPSSGTIMVVACMYAAPDGVY